MKSFFSSATSDDSESSRSASVALCRFAGDWVGGSGAAAALPPASSSVTCKQAHVVQHAAVGLATLSGTTIRERTSSVSFRFLTGVSLSTSVASWADCRRSLASCCRFAASSVCSPASCCSAASLAAPSCDCSAVIRVVCSCSCAELPAPAPPPPLLCSWTSSVRRWRSCKTRPSAG